MGNKNIKVTGTGYDEIEYNEVTKTYDFIVDGVSRAEAVFDDISGTFIFRAIGGNKISVGTESYPNALTVDDASGNVAINGYQEELRNLTQAEIQQLENIGSNIVGSSQWGHIANLDQNLSKSSTPQFKEMIIGSNVTPANNYKLHRGATSLQIVPADDATAEGTDATNIKSIEAFGTVPVGTIMAWNPGYFDSNNNTNYAYESSIVTANNITAANTYLNPRGWHVCDGNAPNDSASPIFNTASRYKPNLTNDRFIQGSTTVGGKLDNSNASTHTHTSSLNSAVANHTHTDDFSFTVQNHQHGVQAHYHGFGAGSGMTATGQTLSTTNISLASGSAAGQAYSGNSGSVSIGGSDGIHGHSIPPANGYGAIINTGANNRTILADGTGGGGGTIYVPNNSGGHGHSGTVDIGHTHSASSVSGTTNIGHTHGSSSVSGNVGLVTGGVDGNAAQNTTNSGTHVASKSGGVTSSGSHTASVSGTIGGNSVENRPNYLSCFYIIRIK